jgi:hypothetical protein
LPAVVDANRLNEEKKRTQSESIKTARRARGGMWIKCATHGGRVVIVGLLQYRKMFLTDKKKMGAAHEHGKDNMIKV